MMDRLALASAAIGPFEAKTKKERALHPDQTKLLCLVQQKALPYHRKTDPCKLTHRI